MQWSHVLGAAPDIETLVACLWSVWPRVPPDVSKARAPAPTRARVTQDIPEPGVTRGGVMGVVVSVSVTTGSSVTMSLVSAIVHLTQGARNNRQRHLLHKHPPPRSHLHLQLLH